jgi:hypothetical protein
MYTTLRTAALAATLFAALSAHAGDAGQDTYRRVVLGDSSVAAQPAPAAATERVVPGSYARYLIKNGMDVNQALAIARDAGETPTVERQPAVAARELSGFERYERAMGRRING